MNANQCLEVFNNISAICHHELAKEFIFSCSMNPSRAKPI